MTLPNSFPGVPTPNYTSMDRTRIAERQASEQRQTIYGTARSTDGDGNTVLGADLAGQSWGLALPHLHAPCYPMKPYLGDAGYTITPAFCATVPVLAQQINIGVRWAVATTAPNTGVGEFEIRWNRGILPLGRGTGPNDSLLIDSWVSPAPGVQGTGGELVRTKSFLWPSDGPQPVVFRDPQMVTISVWTNIQAATGLATDIARVAPAWCYQSGVNQQG